ncbi:MAG: RHS repeat domain-containing protein [Pyrinomonadaceae bacterium]
MHNSSHKMLTKIEILFSRTLEKVPTHALSSLRHFAMLGITARQWTACMLICALLGLSVAAPVGVSMPRAVNSDSVNYEPVNEETSVFTSTFRNLNAEIEAKLTPWRSMNWSVSDNSNTEGKTTKPPTSDSKTIGDEDKDKPSADAEKSDAESREHLPDQPLTEPAIGASSPTAPAAPPPDDDETRSSFTAENNLGRPMGQVDAQAPNTPAALRRIEERIGSANFNFEVPVASLPGRGIDGGISLSYNSRIWNYYQNPIDSDHSRYRYNIDGDWLAPGFKMTLGSIKRINYYNYSLTSPDGTRHELTYISGNVSARTYESTDGTFVKLNITASATTGDVNSTAVVRYPDGSTAIYTSLEAGPSHYKFFPTKITDRNGNTIYIGYRPNDIDGRISYIHDTLNRQINFYYDAGNKLIAVTVPGFNGGSERQTVRFYYETMNFDTTTPRFQNVNHTIPSSAEVLKYVYFPGTNTGYKYDYSPAWGMIYKITNLRGMQVSDPTNLTQIGTVTNEGQAAATTQYNYPLTLGAPLTDVPRFTTRTDDWAGRTTAQPSVTNYQLEEDLTINRMKSKITSPDGTITETWAMISPNGWDDGLVTDTFTRTLINPQLQTYKTWAHSKLFWGNQTGIGGRQNPRLLKVEQTNDANQTRATTFEYDNYNNQTLVKEHDFAAPDSLGTELRKTEITYQTGTGWINNRLLSLPTLVKTTVNGTVVSKTAYEYDNNGGSASSNLVARSDIDPQTHDRRYNWSNGSDEVCTWNPETQEEECNTVWVYDSATDYRGNVTKIIAFPDTSASETDPNNSVTTMKYDVAGNTVESGASCCKEKEWIYVKDSNPANNNEYAYPMTEKRGDQGQLQTSVTYDRNTGLVKTATDENGQVSTVTYNPANLRVTRTDSPNGAWTTTEYNDAVFPYHVNSTASLDATRSVSSLSFLNGAGQQFRTRGQTVDGFVSSDVEFDEMGRPKKSFNPYTVANLGDTRPSGIKFSEITQSDALGRTLQSKLPDDTLVSASYNGLVATTTDQAGKSRRQLADALGRTIRVDEPDANGNLGDVATPAQPTYYEYDGNDNLTKVTQSDGTTIQERKFKYDSLSRLTHEKQVEATATLNDAGVKVASGGLWTKYLKYTPEGQLDFGRDARDVVTTFSYDGLNRVTSVTYSGETGYQTPAVTYTYDQTRAGHFNSGALTKVETAASGDAPATKMEFDHDLMGRVSKHRQWIGTQQYDLEYGYNLAGELTSEKYPSGRIVTNSYDSHGRLSSLADASRTYVSGLQYQGNGGSLSSMSFGNGTTQTFGLNDRFQMVSQELKKGSETLEKYSYGYGQIDGAGNLDLTKNNSQLSQIESYIGAAKQWTQKFKYDSLGRLSESEEKRGDTNALSYKQKFDYDRFGNMYRILASNPTGQETPIPTTWIEWADIDKSKNRLTSSTTYDDAGNVVTDNKFRAMGFGYDANGRVVKATKASTPDALSVYDAAGMRVAEKVNDVWRFLVFDIGGKLVAEYGGVQSTDEGGVKYLFSDWQGSTRAVVSNSGFMLGRNDYTAYGEEIQAGVGLRTTTQGFGSAINVRQKYGLTERDDATGTDHTWFRKHENRAGRWTSPDPYKGSCVVGEPQSWNRYSYVKNDPTNFIDPSGLCTVITGPNGPILGPDCWINIYPSSGALGGGSGGGGGSIYGRSYYAKCAGEGGCGGGMGGPSTGVPPGQPPRDSGETYEEKQRKKCVAEKKAALDRERQEALNQANTAKRIGRSILFSVARGAVIGGVLGGIGGAGFAGVGAVPGAILGVVVGGALGGAGSSVTAPAMEIGYRAIYDPVKYRVKLAQAIAECNRQVWL